VIGISTSYRRALKNARLRVGSGVLALFVLALLPAATGAATDPTDAQYSSSLDQISAGSGSGGGGDPGSAARDAAGGLPFTGLDVGLLAVVAAGLVLAGLLLRRQRAAEPRA
jgi:hypothetical protein